MTLSKYSILQTNTPVIYHHHHVSEPHTLFYQMTCHDGVSFFTDRQWTVLSTSLVVGGTGDGGRRLLPLPAPASPASAGGGASFCWAQSIVCSRTVCDDLSLLELVTCLRGQALDPLLSVQIEHDVSQLLLQFWNHHVLTLSCRENTSNTPEYVLGICIWLITGKPFTNIEKCQEQYIKV